jgi:hypothetical protein
MQGGPARSAPRTRRGPISAPRAAGSRQHGPASPAARPRARAAAVRAPLRAGHSFPPPRPAPADHPLAPLPP